MNKIMLSALMLLSFTINAQMKVVKEEPTQQIGKVGNFAATFVDMTKKGDTYTIQYQDLQYKKLTVYQSFSFKDIDNTLESFYNLILENFQLVPKEDIKVELGNSIVLLKFTKMMGVVSMQFISSTKEGNSMGLSSYMTKKQIIKLFGKQ